MPKIEVDHLSAVYTDTTGKPLNALNDVSFSVDRGEFVSVIGSSGCGKSTLLRVLQGLMSPVSGEVRISGKPITGPGTDRGVVSQEDGLFPWMTARGNIAFAVKQARRLPRKACENIADDFLHRVNLDGFGGKYPHELSGGMKQRVAIARALAMDTDMLLMDEPFSALDTKTRKEMQELLLSLWEGDGSNSRKTVVFVTHDIDEAIFLSDRALMLAGRPGMLHRVIQIPFQRPRNHAALVMEPDFPSVRNKLMSLFFDELISMIGGEEVVL